MQNILIDMNFTFLSFVALSFYLHPRPVRDGCCSQSDNETPLATITSAVPCSCPLLQTHISLILENDSFVNRHTSPAL
jgi:hypothetical protein